MTNKKDFLTLLPSFGILTFIGLYIYSASLYPGGSQADINSIGFDWFNNYWCNLMSANGMNGIENPARPVALFAMVILCSSMTLFFFKFAKYFVKNRNWKRTIKIAGTLAMLSAVFIFTKFHDVMTTILSICGVIGIIGIIRALHINKMTFFKISGIISMTLVGIINLFYYNENLIKYLPIVQVAAFILILAWTVALNLKMTSKDVKQRPV